MDVLNFMIKIDHIKIFLYFLVQIKDYHYLQKKDLTKFKKIRFFSVYKFDNLDTNFYETYNPRYNPVSSKPSFNEFFIHIKNEKFYNNTHCNLDIYYLNKELMVDELYDFHNFNSEIMK